MLRKSRAQRAIGKQLDAQLRRLFAHARQKLAVHSGNSPVRVFLKNDPIYYNMHFYLHEERPN